MLTPFKYCLQVYTNLKRRTIAPATVGRISRPYQLTINAVGQ
jgi:hypothetical protein